MNTNFWSFFTGSKMSQVDNLNFKYDKAAALEEFGEIMKWEECISIKIMKKANDNVRSKQK